MSLLVYLFPFPKAIESIEFSAFVLQFFLSLFIFERTWAGEGQRERESQNPKQAPGSRLRAHSTEPDMELELMNLKIMTWAEVGRLTDWATQAPYEFVF